MQAMIQQTETNLDPYAPVKVPPLRASGARPAADAGGGGGVLCHVDTRSEVPVQTQVHELDARLRLCLNELSDLKLQLERQGKDAVQAGIGRVRDELKKDLSLLEHRTVDEARVLGHELRCRIADSEQAAREDKRRRDDAAKKLRLRDEQYGELYEQVRDVATGLGARVDAMEASLRGRLREGVKQDDDRFVDVKNDVRYQGERMEEAKRALGMRMDQVADTVRKEVAGMTDVVRLMVREVWKEHMAAVYSKVNESLEGFDATLGRQVERQKELESSVRHGQAEAEAEVGRVREEMRKLAATQAKGTREAVRLAEALEGHKTQLALSRGLPDEISRLQLGYKKLHETLPSIEATTRKHDASIEVIKQVPDLVEELRWELRRYVASFVGFLCSALGNREHPHTGCKIRCSAKKASCRT